MRTTFSVGDLLRVKPASDMIHYQTQKSLFGSSGLVLVMQQLEGNKLFHGYTCETGDVRLWSYDQFMLVSKAGG
jgi:hypothetical protein